ncbi:LacI family DNA-binding transcriptional regulator [Cellulomonas citrea]|uniref:LacI family DNA-binding transcriptional regulator n=1 Tax=Cellulomonas citrea TaxID=1909423 RepID=UPI00135A9C61|nr:LacI family DNA-binding transcriptional regulator [Cellulomonas citrea]
MRGNGAVAPATSGGAPTLEQVAELAGVSRSTASRAINGGERVSEAAMASVKAAVASLGYTPNRAARSLVTRRTDSIALVVPEPDEFALSDPFVIGILSGLSSSLADSDVQVVLVIARPGQAERTARFLRGGHVDGAIVVSHHLGGDMDPALGDLALPHVFVGRPLLATGPGHTVPQYVDTDNEGGGVLATRHLIERGRRRIATIAGPEDMSAGIDRLTGWRKELEAAGLATDAVVHGDFTLAGGRAAAHRLLDEYPDLDGIVAASDLMAVGALAALAARGKVVPRDVAVVGYDNLGVAATAQPPLTTVVQPVVAMAAAAGERLLDLLAGGAPREPRVFPAELVVRASS